MINFALLFLIIASVILVILILIFIQKLHHAYYKKRVKKARDYLYQIYRHQKNIKKPVHDFFIFKTFMKLEHQIILDSQEQQQVLHQLNLKKLLKKCKRMTKSMFLHRRIKGIRYLSHINTLEARAILKTILHNARYKATIFYTIYSVINYIDEELFNLILKKIKPLNQLYLKRVAILITNHFGQFQPYLKNLSDSNDERIIFILTHVSKRYNACGDKTFFQRMIDTYITKPIKTPLANDIRDNILEGLLLRSDDILRTDIILYHEDVHVRTYGFKAIAQLETTDSFITLLQLKSDYPSLAEEITSAIESNFNMKELLFYILKNPTVYQWNENNLVLQLFANHTSQLLFELQSENSPRIQEWIKQMVKNGYTSSLITFINENNKRDLEQQIFDIIYPVLKQKDTVKHTFEVYVKQDILSRHGLRKKEYRSSEKEKMPFELSKVIWMSIILIITILWYPSLSFARHGLDLFNSSFISFLKTFVTDTNYYLVVYFLIANMIYFLLLLLSVYGAHKQNTLWRLKSEPLLYEDSLLPAVSIIAPAYNEEVSIISNIQSLLNLKYPNYEVIVVNDGSKDNTLQVVIDQFELDRNDPSYKQHLKTKAVKGVYTTPTIPNLVVIDKENGGKADALNVGINKAKHPYICGIDADSLLEQDALLRLMSSTLDRKQPPVALGGNIIPANDSVIDRGHIEQVRFPKKTLTRFQAIEYLRAFTSGRIGWSLLNSLLIISGAFGVFKKQDIIEIGGYITSSGKFKKDTVGEDMELVVRLTHNKLKKKEKYYISYIYHAGCHTELPSNISTLLKQRNRWHRGLIDILSYHRSILFNPRYKQIGFFAMPYFYFFEVIGPFIETLGYISLILSFAFGFLAPQVVLNYFLLTIFIGIIISLMSLLVSENVTPKTAKKDVFLLILYAVFENFGYRQLISFHRVYSFFTAYVEQGKWGEQKRAGFSKKQK